MKNVWSSATILTRCYKVIVAVFDTFLCHAIGFDQEARCWYVNRTFIPCCFTTQMFYVWVLWWCLHRTNAMLLCMMQHHAILVKEFVSIYAVFVYQIMVRVCSHHKQSRAVSSGINVYIVLNVDTLGCSHCKLSGAARSRAEQSGTLGKFGGIFCCSLRA